MLMSSVNSHQNAPSTVPFSATTAVSIARVSKRYRRGPWALRDVSLELSYGTITALVGPNGAGKSTLIRICVGFESPTLGRVIVGENGEPHLRHATRSVGYVAQRPSFYDRLTVADHLDLAYHYDSRFDRSAAGRRMDSLGIPSLAKARELSGGQQAQLALTLATAGRPRVLFLDEPLASLDPLARREFLRVVIGIVREIGAAVVLSSHLLADVEAVADRLVVLRAGQLRYDATVQAAISTHFVVDDEASLAPTALVGRFVSLDGHALALTSAIEGHSGRPATLEEVAMGYLAGEP